MLVKGYDSYSHDTIDEAGVFIASNGISGSLDASEADKEEHDGADELDACCFKVALDVREDAGLAAMSGTRRAGSETHHRVGVVRIVKVREGT
jgi:hypothetical protein